MNHPNYAQLVKDAIKMRDIVEFYGFKIMNKNRIQCPIHNGKDYNFSFGPDIWHCFVCGETGDQISFVQKVFGLGFQDSLKKLNEDFALGIPIGKEIDEKKRIELEEKANKRKREIQEKIQKGADLKNAYFAAFDDWIKYDKAIRSNRPKYYWEKLKPEFVEAITKIDYAQYILSCAETELYEYERSCN